MRALSFYRQEEHPQWGRPYLAISIYRHVQKYPLSGIRIGDYLSITTFVP